MGEETMIRLIIDRYEGNFAIVELADKSTTNIPKSILPPQAVEGDVIKIEVDSEETSNRKATVTKLMEELWKK